MRKEKNARKRRKSFFFRSLKLFLLLCSCRRCRLKLLQVARDERLGPRQAQRLARPQRLGPPPQRPRRPPRGQGRSERSLRRRRPGRRPRGDGGPLPLGRGLPPRRLRFLPRRFRVRFRGGCLRLGLRDALGAGCPGLRELGSGFLRGRPSLCRCARGSLRRCRRLPAFASAASSWALRAPPPAPPLRLSRSPAAPWKPPRPPWRVQADPLRQPASAAALRTKSTAAAASVASADAARPFSCSSSLAAERLSEPALYLHRIRLWPAASFAESELGRKPLQFGGGSQRAAAAAAAAAAASLFLLRCCSCRLSPLLLRRLSLKQPSSLVDARTSAAASSAFARACDATACALRASACQDRAEASAAARSRRCFSSSSESFSSSALALLLLLLLLELAAFSAAALASASSFLAWASSLSSSDSFDCRADRAEAWASSWRWRSAEA